MNFFKWLIDDIKGDYQTLKEILKGEYKGKYTLNQLISIDWKDLANKYWIWLLIIILAFCVGYFMSTQIMENACNEFIIKNQLVPNPFIESIKNITNNITFK